VTRIQASVRRSIAASVLLLLAVSAAATGHAQEPVPDPTVTPPAVRGPETVEFPGPPRSPLGAFVRSMAIPGWGQAWVGAHTRGGVYFAMEAGSLWMVYRTRQKLAEAEARDAWLREIGQLGERERSPLVRSRRDQREAWVTLAVFTVFLSGADAFVSAYLADFDDRVLVIPEDDGAFRIQASIPLGRR
jgi:hypothetical protein